MTNVTISSPSCPICSKGDVVFVSEHFNLSGTEIWFCSVCCYWFSYPEPDDLQLRNYYTETYSPLRSRFLGTQYRQCMEMRAKAQLRFIKSSLAQADLASELSGCRAIDWGCGVGALVALLQQEGADAVGYDSDSVAIEFGRKQWAANISLGDIDDLGGLQMEFDLLSLSHVVEHLPGIQVTLKTLLDHVRPGRYVFIEVPNCSAGMFDARVDTESHLSFFSKQSLTLLLEGLGVQVLACASCGPPQSSLFKQDELTTPATLVQRVISRVKALQINMAERLGVKQRPLIYDGFYEHYSQDDNGIWLRCLGRIPARTNISGAEPQKLSMLDENFLWQ